LGLAPFFKTPVNLFKASISHVTPYEILNSRAKGWDVDLAARAIVGSCIAASLAALALSGHLTGGGSTDYRKEETLRATGWQQYSLKIGDHFYSYHRLEPFGLIAGMVADAVHGAQKGDSEAVTQSKANIAVQHIARNLDDFPAESETRDRVLPRKSIDGARRDPKHISDLTHEKVAVTVFEFVDKPALDRGEYR
jgi:hypothetical protein